jgi:hypothetical protein
MTKAIDKKISLEWKRNHSTKVEHDFVQHDIKDSYDQMIADNDFIYIGVNSRRGKIHILDAKTFEVCHVLELSVPPNFSDGDNVNDVNNDNNVNNDNIELQITGRRYTYAIRMVVTEDYLIAIVAFSR